MTTKLNTIIFTVARKLKDARASLSASDSDKRYSNTLLTTYANDSIRDFLREQLEVLGPEAFVEKFPEYVKESGNLVIAAAEVTRPSDALFILDLFKADLSLSFTRKSPSEIADFKTARDAAVIPSTTEPVFWDEDGKIKVLPNSAGINDATVKARYIVTHQDIAINATASGNGNYQVTGAPTFTAATKLLTATPAANFGANDLGRKILMKDVAHIVYEGLVESAPSTTTLVLKGDGLPSVDKTISHWLISYVDDSTDLKLNQVFHGEIIERAFQKAQADAVAGAV